MKTEIDIRNLSRGQCVEMLESACIQCYDSETLDVLQEAVRVNIEDGTIDPSLFQ